MKDLIVGIFKAIAEALLSVVAAVMLVVLGAVIAGYGLYKDWGWLTNGGVIVAALGLAFLFKWWQSDD